MRCSVRWLSILILCALVSVGCAAGGGDDASSVVATEPVVAVGPSGDGLGQVVMTLSCGEEADTQLVPALALLHHMTYTEAEAMFRNAAEIEPDCSLAHWGVAMSYVHPLWPDVVGEEQLRDGSEHLEMARQASIRDARTDAFIAALAGYYEAPEGATEPERLAAFRNGWAAAHEAFPDDPEAASFHALSILATASGDAGHPDQRRAGEILEEVNAAVTNHPGGHHYTIHAYDFPALAEGALPTARRYGEVAPDNPHALHMTSHIYTRLGLWEDSIEYNRRAADAAYGSPMGGRVSHHALHALDYLVYAHLQRGDHAAAEEVAAELASLDEAHDSAATAYAAAAVPVRMVLERENWEAAAEMTEPTEGHLAWESYPHLAAIPVFARAIGSARTDRLERAEEAVARLAELRDAAGQVPGAYDWATQVEIQRLAAQAWLEHARGNRDAGLATAREAADLEATTSKNPVTPGEVLPAGELYADMLLANGQAAEALERYEAALERTPNRHRSLVGAAAAAREAGMADRAAEFEQLLRAQSAERAAEEAGESEVR